MTISLSILSFADILHHAADHCLATGTEKTLEESQGKNGFSCLAISQAVYQLTGKYPETPEERACQNWYKDNFLGWDDYRGAALFMPDENADNGYPYPLRQQIRYAHLKLAALIAEEECL